MYPAIAPLNVGMLDVGDGHSLYWETVGTPTGTPVVFLHGGPGAGTTAGARRYFNPDRFYAVLFDQRGCGRSQPTADGPDVDLSTNTTDHLVADIEALRVHLGIERWIVVGVSWGSTLALVYAQRHPDRVRSMVLAAVTAGTRDEITWITRDMGRIFPQEWDEFIAIVPEAEREGDLAAAYARLLASSDPDIRHDAARRWCAWEDTHVSLMPGWTHRVRYDDAGYRAVFARLVTHYWANGCFLDDNEIAKGMSRIATIPGILVHGRHDISSPLVTAWRLHKRWAASRLVVVDDAGHGGGGFGTALISAIDDIGHAGDEPVDPPNG